MNYPIGFMQGRLSPVVNSVIQEFPWSNWRKEFSLAQEIGISIMEWTLDYKDLYKNPLLTIEGQDEIRCLSLKHNIRIPSLTGDCFMQLPLWKESGVNRKLLELDFINIVKSCHAVGISLIIIPLVDNGRLENLAQEDNLIEFLNRKKSILRENNVKVSFESDYPPNKLKRFIERLDKDIFGVNYDIGNSSAMGFSPDSEFAEYGEFINNVHVKDRVFGGTTVPLGQGDANFNLVFSGLSKLNYKGNYVLQTARAKNNNHSAVLKNYYQMTSDWITQNESRPEK